MLAWTLQITKPLYYVREIGLFILHIKINSELNFYLSYIIAKKDLLSQSMAGEKDWPILCPKPYFVKSKVRNGICFVDLSVRLT